MKSIASFSNRIIVTSSTLHLCRFNGRRLSFSVVWLSSRSNDSFIDKNLPHPTIPSNSILKGMLQGRELFPDYLVTQKDVDDIIAAELATLNRFELVTFLLLSKKNRNRRIEIVRRNLVTIAGCLNQFPTSSWKAKEVAIIINSLQSVLCNDIGVNKVLVVLTTIVNESLKDLGPQSLTSQGIAMILYG